MNSITVFWAKFRPYLLYDFNINSHTLIADHLEWQFSEFCVCIIRFIAPVERFIAPVERGKNNNIPALECSVKAGKNYTVKEDTIQYICRCATCD